MSPSLLLCLLIVGASHHSTWHGSEMQLCFLLGNGEGWLFLKWWNSAAHCAGGTWEPLIRLGPPGELMGGPS